ncbi:MAG: aldehyde dehydrogenase family protein [Verrucomicrobia bacterium]|nr:aldehyde dehydrogenase family protein [Verrucomicrobiota bacterium]MDA1066513.1 aldehyde dehydrogenase family protein [Verrucomicrobiota bacterium]
MPRISITKTPKAYVGGKFIRSESGRVFPLEDKAGQFICNIPQCTRKDTRNAVELAGNAGSSWAARTAYNRGQVLYRLGEMMESRSEELAQAIAVTGIIDLRKARTEVSVAIDRVIYYAGWTDKYEQVLGNTNPVAGSFFNFSVTEPIGVVGVFCSDGSPLLGLISQVLPIITSGNSVVALASTSNPYPAILLGEMLATSDLPGGVLNILTGFKDELLETFASHEQIRGLDLSVDDKLRKQAEVLAAKSVKRVKVRPESDEALFEDSAQSLYVIRNFLEFKTTWHPIGV